MSQAESAQPVAEAAEIAPIAQSNVELLRQLEARGFSVDERAAVQRAYEMILSVNACHYRCSGRTLVDHLVGTTSVVASLGADPEWVVASLLHAVYVHGDFGTLRKRPGAAQRARVRALAGERAEAIVMRYSHMYWGRSAVPELRRALPTFGRLDREALLIRLADQLDIYGTREALYYNSLAQRRAFARDLGPTVVEMAAETGYPALAAALERAYADVLDSPVPAALVEPAWRDAYVLPASYRTRTAVALYRTVRARLWAWTGR